MDKLAAIHMSEETETCIEHLTDKSKNVLSVQPIGFARI